MNAQQLRQALSKLNGERDIVFYFEGADECLVHNGSLSNHNAWRRKLRRAGVEIETENDTEVGAAYLTWKMREGATLGEALESSLSDLDGFFTFVVGTRDGFGVVRDPIACKPAVMAETDATEIVTGDGSH